MIEHAIYFGKHDFYEIIKNVGGVWNDTKERPIVCLIRLSEYDDIYWAIPMGNWNHRTKAAQDRINNYMDLPENDIRSCFYHVGNTDETSIFFISDVIPITEKYIDRTYKNKYTGQDYIIKNGVLLAELKRKLLRILAWENANPNYYRQHITDIKNYLINEISIENRICL